LDGTRQHPTPLRHPLSLREMLLRGLLAVVVGSLIAIADGQQIYSGGWCAASNKSLHVNLTGNDAFNLWEIDLENEDRDTEITNLQECMAACEAEPGIGGKANLACVEYKETKEMNGVDDCYCMVIFTAKVGSYSMASDDGGYQAEAGCWYQESGSTTAVYNDGSGGTDRLPCCAAVHWAGGSIDSEAIPAGLENGGRPTCSELDDGSSSDSPCFGVEMQACLVTDSALQANDAFNICFGDSSGTGASRVPLKELGSGDLILDSETSTSRVIVNEHVHSTQTSALLTMVTTKGELISTPDHYIATGGGFNAAGKATALVDAAGEAVTVERTSVKTGEVVNPITVSGKILVATASGAPFRATTYGGWIAETALRFGGMLTSASLSNGLSFVFPASVQAFHDSVIEPVAPSQAAFSIWSQLFTATPMMLHPIAFFVLDFAVAASFAAWAMCSVSGAALAAAAAFKLRTRK